MSASATGLMDSIQAAFGSKAVSVVAALGEVTLVIKADDVLEIMSVLRDRPELRFEQLIDLCGVDYGSYGKVAWSGTPVSEGGAGAPLAGAAPDTDAVPPSGDIPPFPATTSAPPEAKPAGARFAVGYHLLSLT